MNKFRTDVTKGGYRILSLHGPDECEEYAGVLAGKYGALICCRWWHDGRRLYNNDDNDDQNFDLIPRDEPKPDNKIEARLEYLEEKDKKTDERLEALEKDTDGTINNLFDRVNRVQYDLTSVRDQLQRTNFVRRIEQLEQLVSELAADEMAKLGQEIQPEDGLVKRLEALEKKNEKDDNRHESFKAMLRDWHAGYKDLGERIEALEQDSKETDTWGVRVNGDLHEMHNRILKLEQFNRELLTIRKAVEQLNEGTQPSDDGVGVISSVNGAINATNTQHTSNNVTVPGNYPSSFTPTWAPANVVVTGQPSDKGVWVTKEMLEDIPFGSVVAKRLGLEE